MYLLQYPLKQKAYTAVLNRYTNRRKHDHWAWKEARNWGKVPSTTGRCCATTSRAPPSRLSGPWPVVEVSSEFLASSTRRRVAYLQVFLENCVADRIPDEDLRDAVTCTEDAKRKTVAALDVVHALNKASRTPCSETKTS